MTFEEFESSLQKGEPPGGLDPLLLSLWYDGKGDWERSHEIAQDINNQHGAHLHGYLHWKEGDLWNADYWYRQAGLKRPDRTLKEEWMVLVKKFLNEV